MTTTYLSVAAVRIQAWLSRCPDLRGRRGASALLSEHADASAVAKALAVRFPTITPNLDAPSIDGVIELIHHDAAPESVARAALDALLADLPGIEIEAVWVTAASYQEALIDLIPGGNPTGRLRTLPTVNEMPVFARCSVTGTDVAVTSQLVDGRRERLGLDAATRIDAAGRRTSTRRADIGAPGLDAERRLADSLGLTAEVDDFDGLAKLGPASAKRNHLATVFIDGNSVGVAFRNLAPDKRLDLSKRIKAATDDSLAVAVRHVMEGSGLDTLPVIPHVVGGDDVLVSLPAAMALPFTRSFLQRFAECLAGTGISASAGIAIAHASHPFTTVVAVADELLGKAKADHGGAMAAIAVAELTTESAEPASSAHSWLLTELDAAQADLDLLVETGKSTRHELFRAATEPDWSVAASLLARQLNRAGLSRSFTASPDEPVKFAHLLRLARWWPKASTT